MQRALVFASGNLCVRLFRLGKTEIVEERHHVVELGVVPMQTRQVHLGQLHGRDLSRANQLSQVTDRPERDVLEIRRALHDGRRA